MGNGWADEVCPRWHVAIQRRYPSARREQFRGQARGARRHGGHPNHENTTVRPTVQNHFTRSVTAYGWDAHPLRISICSDGVSERCIWHAFALPNFSTLRGIRENLTAVLQ